MRCSSTEFVTAAQGVDGPRRSAPRTDALCTLAAGGRSGRLACVRGCLLPPAFCRLPGALVSALATRLPRSCEGALRRVLPAGPHRAAPVALLSRTHADVRRTWCTASLPSQALHGSTSAACVVEPDTTRGWRVRPWTTSSASSTVPPPRFGSCLCVCYSSLAQRVRSRSSCKKRSAELLPVLPVLLLSQQRLVDGLELC